MNKPFRTFLIAAGAAAATFAGVAPAVACSSEPFIASICITAANFCPDGFLEANGQAVSIQANQPLYSLIGSMYGAATPTTFILPDLRGRTPVGIGQGVNLSGITQGQRRGQEQVTLGYSQLPLTSNQAGSGSQVTTAAPATDSTKPQPVATVPPQLGLLYCIAATGIYPPRP